MEATYYGVPLIALPLFADQDFSAYRIQAQEVGVAVELREFSEEVLDSAIHEILHNTK
jgi:glucuronosyltransferase